jgi:hypothetical protein
MDVEYGGFEFLIALGAFSDGGSIILNQNSPVDNPAYIAALKQLQVHVPYYHIRAYLDSEMHEYYYKGDWSNDPHLKLIIEAYEQNIIPITEEMYKRVISWMNGKAYLVTYPPKQVIDGFTYLMVDSNGLYKIGYSKDPATRLKKITSKANPVSIVCQIRNTNCAYLEYELHTKFHERRISGEWFELTAEDVDYITALAVGV